MMGNFNASPVIAPHDHDPPQSHTASQRSGYRPFPVSLCVPDATDVYDVLSALSGRGLSFVSGLNSPVRMYDPHNRNQRWFG
jgi:hypothetical protein